MGKVEKSNDVGGKSWEKKRKVTLAGLVCWPHFDRPWRWDYLAWRSSGVWVTLEQVEPGTALGLACVV